MKDKRILIVEDEQTIADSLLFVLQKDGFHAVHYSTGVEAVAAVERQAWDLIILDIGLPDMDGFELCRKIRSRNQSIPLVFLTARNTEIDRVVGLEIGGTDYLTKPFSPREVVAKIKALLRLVEGLKSVSKQDKSDDLRDTSVRSPFVVDQERFQISYFGVNLSLSRQEYRILNILLTRPGWVYSRDKLMDLAWDAPEASQDRTVDTHMKTIRAKLKSIKDDVDPIVTHRGIGYSIRESW